MKKVLPLFALFLSAIVVFALTIPSPATSEVGGDEFVCEQTIAEDVKCNLSYFVGSQLDSAVELAEEQDRYSDLYNEGENE